MKLPLIVSVSLCFLALLQAGVGSRYSAGGNQDAGSVEPSYAWTRLTPDAGFEKSYNYQLFADDHYVRAFHHKGVWTSSDGGTWRKTGLKDIVNRQAFLDYVKFKGAIYALGTFDG